MEPIHDRMPVILRPEAEKVWLDNEAKLEDWKSVLQPYPADLMTAYAVSGRVNSPKYDDPAVMAPM
jgi:putative SOS response-associated peptidase YedK